MSTAVPALVASFGAVAHAGGLPNGGQVTGGSATISQTSATRMQITSTTARSAISWQDFSIGSGDSVNITQPNGGTQLESVRGTNVSQIFGALTSNGSIVVANPNGIWFGPNAQVDVAGLAAVAASPTNADVQTFISGGHLNVSQAGNANAAVVNQGHITITNAGLGAFVAPGVRNDGIIQAKLGTVQLSSGTTATLDFYGDGLISIAVSGQTLAQAIDPSTGKPMSAAVGNTGTINADGGTVLITANTAANVVNDAINVSGVVQAQSVTMQGDQVVLGGSASVVATNTTATTVQTGQIAVNATGGNVQVAGNLDASGYGAGQTGGNIQVTGQTVNVTTTAFIDASGDDGGGAAYIGGGPHGQGTTVTATTTTVSKGATIKANAVTKGNGGTVAVWSSQHTSFDGIVEAMGGAQGGNGGFVETSGAQLTVGNGATVNTSAIRGQSGLWLLDPNDINIASGGDIDPNTITTALSSGNVEIDTEGNIGTAGTGTITVNGAIVWNSSDSLSLLAENNINVNASIQNSGTGAVNLVAGWDGHTGLSGGNTNATSVTYTSGGTVNINTIETTVGAYGNTGSNGAGAGSVAIGGSGLSSAVAVGSAGGTTTVLGNNVSLIGSNFTQGAGAQIGYNISPTSSASASGGITVDALGAVSLQANLFGFAQIGHGGYNASTFVSSSHSGSLTGAITVNAASVALTAGNNGQGSYAQIGHGGYGAFSTVNSDVTTVTASGTITVNATGASSTGNITLNGGINGESNYAQIGHGGADFASDFSGAPLTLGGDVAITATGTVAVDAGGNSGLGAVRDYAQIGHGGLFAGQSHSGTDTISGNITVSAATLSLSGGNESASYAQIGHGAADQSASSPFTVSGNIDVRVAGGTLSGSAGTGGMLIGGAAAGTVSDSIFIEAADLSGFSPGNVANTAGGEIVIALTDPLGYSAPGFSVSASSAFALLTEGPLTVGGAISVSGGGVLDLVSGWNGTAGVPPTPGASTFDLSTGTGALQSGAYGNGGNGITLDSNVTGAGAVTFAGPVSLGGNVTVSSGGTLDFLSTLAGNGDNITFVDDTSPVFGGTVSNIGTATLAPRTAADTIAVGNSTQQALATGRTVTYDFSTGDAATLLAAAATVGIGTGSDTGAITATQLTLTKGLALTNGGTGAITVSGVLSLGDFAAQSGSGGIVLDANVTTTGSQTYTGAIVLGGDRLLEATASTATITFGGTATAYNSATNLAVLSGGAIDVNAAIQNAGSGNVSLVAGWDGTAPTSAASVANLISPVHYGATGGDVAIGNGGQTSIVAVGSDSGTTTVLGNNVTVQGGTQGAQIGYNLTHSSGGSATGAITVDATGAVLLQGGSNPFSSGFAQIGQGGFDTDHGYSGAGPTLSGAITVNAASVTLAGGFGPDAYAQIGHGGAAAFSTTDTVPIVIGQIIVNATGSGSNGNIVLTAGLSYAQIGHGGEGFDTNGAIVNNFALGDAITVTSASGTIALTGGTDGGGGEYAQIGNGGYQAIESNAGGGATSGDIAVSAAGLTLTASGDATDYVQIGNGEGSVSIPRGASGTIDVRVSGTLTATPGQNFVIGGAGDASPLFIETSDFGGGAGPGSFASTADGQVVVAVTDPLGYSASSFAPSGGNTFALLTKGPLTISGAISASGGGALDLVSGWNGTSGVPTFGNTFDLSTGTGALKTGAYGVGGNGITLNASVGGAGDVTFAGPVSLGGNVTVSSGGTLDFLSTLNGNNDNITFVDDTLPVFGSTVSSIGTATLAPYTATDTIAVVDGTTPPTANITYDFSTGGAATLLANAATIGIGTGSDSGNITVASLTLTGALALTNGSAGAITLAGALSAHSLAVQSGSGGIALDANVTTAGGQTYSSGVTLGGNVTLADSAGGTIDFASTLSGSASKHNITFVDDTLPVFGSTVLSIGTATLAPYTTSDTMAVGNSTLAPLAPGANVSYDFSSGSLTALAAGAATIGIGTGSDTGIITVTSLTLSPGLALTNASGNIALSGPLSAGSLVANPGILGGSVELDGGSVATTGGQNYSGAVTLGADTTLTDTSGNSALGIQFHGTVDSDGTPRALTTSTTGNSVTFFTHPVGGSHPLASLDVIGKVDFSFGSSPATVTTTGGQTYNGPMILGGAAANNLVSNNGGAIDVLGGASSDVGLVISTSGTVSLGGTFGTGLNALASLTVEGGPSAITISAPEIATQGGGQTYSGAVTLGGNVTLADTNGGAITFDDTVDAATSGGESLTVNTTGTTLFKESVGGGAQLANLDVIGKTDINTASISTTGNQTYGGAVSLEDSGGTTFTASSLHNAGAIDFQSTIDGVAGASLTIPIGANSVTFGGSVGATGPLSAIVDKATDTVIGGATMATTGGSQQYLSDNTTLTNTSGTTFSDSGGGYIQFGALDGATAGTVPLTVSLTGNVADFSGPVGANAPLKSILVSGGETLFDTTAINTTGTQEYADVSVRETNVTLTASTVTFDSTVDSFGGPSTNGDSLTVSGNASFGGTVGGTYALGSLDVTGGTTIGTTAINTTGAQTYGGAVTLGSDATLGASNNSNVTFGGTVDSASGHNYALSVSNGSGTTTFSGAVGGGQVLSTLTVGAAQLDGGTIVTTDGQSYGGTSPDRNTTLGADTTLTNSGGRVVFGFDVGGDYNLVINANNATNVLFGAGVGNNSETALASLTVNGSGGTIQFNFDGASTTGGQYYGDAVTLETGNSTAAFSAGTGIVFAGVLTDHSGSNAGLVVTSGATTFEDSVSVSSINVQAATFDITSGSIATTGGQTYNGAATLAADTTLADSSAGGVDFESTVDSDSGHKRNLTVSGAATFGGNVGAATALGSLGVTGTTEIDAASIITTSGQNYLGAVTLGTSSVTLADSGGNAISFGNTVDSASGHNYALTTDAAGTTTFSGTVGAGQALSSLTVDGAADIDGGSVGTTGGQTYSGAVTLGANTTLTASTVTFVSSVESAGHLAPGPSFVSDDYDLTVSGNASFGGAVGQAIFIFPATLGTLDVTGTTALSGGFVGTTGTQTYGSTVTLGAGATLSSELSTGDAIIFDGPVVSSTALYSLTTETAGGNTVFKSDVGVGGLYSLTVDGGLAVFEPGAAGSAIDILTGGAGGQNYNGGISLAGSGGDAVLEVWNISGTIVIGADSTYDSAGNLSLLSVSGITINHLLQNSGRGAINVVAGWGLTGLSGSGGGQTFDFGSVGAPGTGYGSNGGSVTIDGSSGLAAVGSALGATNVAGYNVVLEGDAHGAQIGFNLGASGTTATGAITVLAANNVTLAGGSGTEAFAQIGHGGELVDTNVNLGAVTLGGAIDVSAVGNIVLQGGSGSASAGTGAYAQIGHGGLGFLANTGASNTTIGDVSVTGDITVTSTGGNGTISLTGGDQWAYAQIGHGGMAFAENQTRGSSETLASVTLSGDITVGAAQNIALAGGTAADDAFDAYAQIGHGGDAALSDIGTALTVTGATQVGGTISVVSSSGSVSLGGHDDYAYAQIGHGGLTFGTFGTFADVGVTGDITVSGANGVSMTGGAGSTAPGNTNTGAYAQVGNGGEAFLSGAGAGVVTLDGAITVDGGSGDIDVKGGSATGNGTGGDSYAQIGLGGDSAFINANVGSLTVGSTAGTIGISTGGAVSLGGGSGSSDYAQIGDGGINFANSATISGAASLGGSVSVTSTHGGISLSSGAGFGAYSQIGDGGAFAFIQATLSGTSGSLTVGSATDSIDVTAAGDITLQGGSNNSGNPLDAYAQIGDGGVAFAQTLHASAGAAAILGDITVTSTGGAVSLSSGNSSGLVGANFGSYAQIGHGGEQAFDAATFDGLTVGGTITVGASGSASDGGVTLSGVSDYVQIGDGGEVFAAFATINGAASVGGSIGVTSVNGTVSLLGGDANDAYAQIGHGGDQAFAGDTQLTSLAIGSATDTITVSAGGDVAMSGGSSTGSADFAYAQIGHGGFQFADGATVSGAASLGGAISVASTSGGVSLGGGTGGDAYAQIGHGGDQALVNANVTGSTTLGGSIDVTAGGDITLAGGASTSTTDNYAQIGHGGLSFGANTGASNTTLGDLSVTGAITIISTSGTASLGGGGDEWDYAQIGHGGLGFASTEGSGTLTLNSATLSGDITVGAAGNISLTGGTGGSNADAFDAYAQIGHGGDAALSGFTLTVTNATNVGGTISVVSSSGSVTLGGADDFAYAQIGHGGFGFGEASALADVNVTGDVAVSGATGVSLTGGAGSTVDVPTTHTNSGGYAQIGHGGEQAFAGAIAGAVTLGGAITVDGGSGDVSLTGGSANGNPGNSVSTGDSYAQIGLGGDVAFAGADFGSLTVGGATSTIGVNTAGAVALDGGSGSGDYAQVGDGGFQFASNATAGTTAGTVFTSGGVTLSGDITVGAASVTLAGDPPSGGAFAYAQIGHGGGAALYNATAGDVTVGGDVSVTASAGDISLTAGTGDAAYAQIGHGGAYFGSAENIIVGSTTLLTGTGATFGNVTLDGNIDVEAVHSGGTSGGVFLTGDIGGAYAQIGDGGQNAFSGISCGCSGGPVTLTSLTVGGAGETITVTGDDGIGLSSISGGYAQIGDGGLDFADGAQISGAATITGDIGVDAVGGRVTLTGDAGSGGYAQIGHGGADAFGRVTAGSLGVSGGITVTAHDDVGVSGGSHFGAYAQIGHGGADFAEGAQISGATTVGGDISVDAVSGGVSVGGGFGAYAQIGHGGDYAFGIIDSVALTVGGDITVTAGDGSVSLAAAPSGYAQIGHGGADFAEGAQISGAATIDGDISVGATNGGVTLTGDLGGGGYAQIGHGGLDAFEFAELGSLTIGGTSADITVTADDAVSLAGGSGENAYAQIGHGGKGFASDATVGTTTGTVFTSGGVTLSGDITVGAESVTLGGGSGHFAYAQIGHGGGTALYNATAGDIWIGGDVSVTASDGDISLTAGSGEATYAQIGHGGAYFGSAENVVVSRTTILHGTGATFGSVTLDGNIDVEATNGGTSGGVFLTGGSDPDAYAQIGHGGSYAFAGAASCGCSGGPITLASLTVGGAGEAITVAGDQDINLTGGSSDGAYVQIGHGGYAFASDATVGTTTTAGFTGGAITVSGDIAVTTGDGFDFSAVGSLSHGGTGAYVQVGHGGYAFAAGSSFGSAAIGGNVDVSVPNGYAFIVSGENTYAYAQIGHGGADAFTFTGTTVSPTYGGIVSVNAGELGVGSFSPFAYGVIGSGNPVPTTIFGSNGVLSGTVDVTTLGDQRYFVDFTDVILAPGTYGTSSGTISFSDGSGGFATVILSGSITIENSTTEWGQITFPASVVTPNMTFVLDGLGDNNTTFNGNVGSTTQPLGTLSVSGGNNFTIASVPPVEVYVDFFTESRNTGVTDFGHTLNVQNQAILSGTNIGDLVCAGGGVSCILGSGTLNGLDIAFLIGGGFDFEDQTLHLFNYQYALSNPGENLGAGGGSNPQAGCSEAEKQANGGSCPAGSGDTTGFANQFLTGSKP